MVPLPFTFEPFLRLSDDPYGILLVLKTFFVFTSKILISVVLEITISASLPSESFPLTVLRSSISTIPSNFVTNLFSSEIFPATPPTWKCSQVSIEFLVLQ